MLRHRFMTAFAAALGLVALPFAPAQAQVEQPLKIVFPFAAGGSGDALSRLVADHLSAGLNRTVIVENVTGAPGTRPGPPAPPDGNTLLLTPIAPVAVYPHVYKNLEYDPFKQLKPVAHVAGFEFALAGGPKVSANSLKELVEWLKANAKEARY